MTSSSVRSDSRFSGSSLLNRVNFLAGLCSSHSSATSSGEGTEVAGAAETSSRLGAVAKQRARVDTRPAVAVGITRRHAVRARGFILGVARRGNGGYVPPVLRRRKACALAAQSRCVGRGRLIDLVDTQTAGRGHATASSRGCCKRGAGACRDGVLQPNARVARAGSRLHLGLRRNLGLPVRPSTF